MKKIYSILVLCVVGVLTYIFGGYTFTHYRVFKPYLDKSFQTNILMDSYNSSILNRMTRVFIDDEEYNLICTTDLSEKGTIDVTSWIVEKNITTLNQYDFNTNNAKFNIKENIPAEAINLTQDEFIARFYNLELDIDSAKVSVKTKTFSNKTKDNETQATFTFPSNYVTTFSLPVFDLTFELTNICLLLTLDTNKTIEEIKLESSTQHYSLSATANGKNISVLY